MNVESLSLFFFISARLNLKMILLVRDPRGSMNSRKDLNFCNWSPACSSASKVCDDLDSDYYSSLALSDAHKSKFRYAKRGGRISRGIFLLEFFFRALRYEDLCADLMGVTKSLFKFLGLDMHDNVRYKILNSTRSDGGTNKKQGMGKNSILFMTSTRFPGDVSNKRM